MIVITGTQRSGTSLMARFFQTCGFDLGTNFWDERVNGGLESPDVCNFYRDTFKDNSFPFSTYWNLIERDSFRSFYDLEKYYQVLKFSYLLSNSAFVEYWLDVRRGKDDRFIVLKRNADQVCLSKKSNPIFMKEDWKYLPKTGTVLEFWFDLCLKLLKDHFKVLVIDFPITYQSSEVLIEDIIKFTGLKMSKNTYKIWDSLYNVNKIQKH